MTQQIHRRRALQLLGGLSAGALVAGVTRQAAAADTLEKIKQSGTMNIGCEATYRPFTFREQGKIVGYDIDLAHLLCEELGVKPEFIDTAWSGVIPALYAGRFDIIMSSVTYTKERMSKVGFSIPYAEASLSLLIRAGDAGKIKSIEDMSGRTVGIKLGSPGEVYQKRLNAEILPAKNLKLTDVKSYDDYPASYLALAQGTVDGVINSLPTLAQVLKDAPGRYALVQGIGPSNWAGIATRMEDKTLVQYLDKQILKLKANNKIYELQEKWFGLKMNLPDTIPNL
jgi:polar amino acid transport system substrate-binding protein